MFPYVIYRIFISGEVHSPTEKYKKPQLPSFFWRWNQGIVRQITQISRSRKAVLKEMNNSIEIHASFREHIYLPGVEMIPVRAFRITPLEVRAYILLELLSRVKLEK